MVQTRFLFTVAIIVAVISLTCENCNAAIAKIGDRRGPSKIARSSFDLEDIDEFLSDDYAEEEFDIDRFLSDAEDETDRALTPTKWLKRQVRRLWRALGPIENSIKTNKDSITAIASDVEKNEMDIDINAVNITSNERDISDNEIQISNHAEAISDNFDEIEIVKNSTRDKIAENAEAIANNTLKIEENQEKIANNTQDIEANYDLFTDALDIGRRRYLTFGGFDNQSTVTEHVFLVEFNSLDNTTKSCLHSSLPAQLKESHVYEYQDTLLVCSAFTNKDGVQDKNNLECYKWNVDTQVWEDFATPDTDSDEEGEQNGIFNFIASVKIPGKGIWFTSSKTSGYGQGMVLLGEDGSWSEFLWPGRARNKGCMVHYNDTSVAYIGGNPSTLSESIDTYNFVTETFEDDTATLPFNLTHTLCAVIPVGLNGNPTVLILGDDGRRKQGDEILENYAHEMVLWDTVTNEVTTAEHPPGYDNNTRFFRPSIATWDDNTIILAASEVKVFENDVSTSAVLTDQWLYSVADGWTNIGPTDPVLISEINYDIYVLNNPDLGAYDSLKECPPDGP